SLSPTAVHHSFFNVYAPPRLLHSFPTRRSSDLELLARVRARLRRGRAEQAPHLRLADLEMDVVTRKARRGGHYLELTAREFELLDRKSTRLNSSHQIISYAVFCLKKKNKENTER